VKESFAHKKGAELSLSYQRYWHTQPQISEPTPKDVSILLILSWLLKRQFFDTRFKANASNILIEESQIYNNKANI
jgi:hypothetical protein